MLLKSLSKIINLIEGYRYYNGGGPMSNLLSKKCIPCSIATDPLNKEEIEKFFKELKDGWIIVEDKQIEKTYKFKDFKEALDFTNLVGELAESEGHHPVIYLAWGRVGIKLWTSNIEGLHENDFILAAKIDELIK